ncbi:unnamed protein product [Cylicocyclus nassatus]|uniref:Neurotransmitter-gated ion-channel ligand-binding domain-containing protein n=1 Tax=Cylicocyclus nassatus TaxID=53992 RepID=A0AA36DLN5_CYLNA|nr:unnamed protein product [Cylicocyclus nassatus]
MLRLVLWLCMLISAICRHDTPIVIERPMNRVEFDDLLMEYNQDQGPHRNMSVAIEITVNSARLSEDVLRTSLTIEQTWNDDRLVFKGSSEVPLPANTHVWYPDTMIINALSNKVKASSMFLNYDGTLRERQLCNVEVVCEESKPDNENLRCPITLTSFSSRGVDYMQYTINMIDIDHVNRILNATISYETKTDHRNRTSSLAHAILYLRKPHHPLGDFIEEFSKAAHLQGEH